MAIPSTVAMATSSALVMQTGAASARGRHSNLAQRSTVRSAPRAPRALGRAQPRGRGQRLTVRAKADDEQVRVEFEGKLGQNVRQGMDGWQTLMTVQKDGKEKDGSAQEGDEVTVDFVCKTEDGVVVASSADNEEELTFEVGTADFMGNPFFQGIDEAVRGLMVGEKASVEASGGEYNPELLFKVPRDHPEVGRLSEEYVDKGGLQEGSAVTLMNGAAALIVKMTDEEVTIDANHPLAGAPLTLDIEVIKIDKRAAQAAGEEA